MDEAHIAATAPAPHDTAAAAPVAEPKAVTRYAPDEGFDLHLRGIDDAALFNDDGTPMTITLLGADSDIAVRSRNGTQNRRFQQGARMKITSEGLESDGVAYLAKLSIGWNITPTKLVPGVDPGLGEGKVPFSEAAAVTIYRNVKLSVIKDQADTSVADRSNFMKASASS